MAWIKAGAVYFAAVFAAGFAMGVIRVLLVIPRVGETVAVCLELPLMLAASWIVCRRVWKRFPDADPARAGAWAFGLLMLAELSLSIIIAGRSVEEHFATYRTVHAMLGLVGQIGFAVIPWIQKQNGVAS
jgi:hypothetical protein